MKMSAFSRLVSRWMRTFAHCLSTQKETATTTEEEKKREWKVPAARQFKFVEFTKCNIVQLGELQKKWERKEICYTILMTVTDNVVATVNFITSNTNNGENILLLPFADVPLLMSKQIEKNFPQGNRFHVGNLWPRRYESSSDKNRPKLEFNFLSFLWLCDSGWSDEYRKSFIDKTIKIGEQQINFNWTRQTIPWYLLLYIHFERLFPFSSFLFW